MCRWWENLGRGHIRPAEAERRHAQLHRPEHEARLLRSDGERNRARLIAAAKRAFAEKGAAAGIEHIARQADVSIATLYRHFPTRD